VATGPQREPPVEPKPRLPAISLAFTIGGGIKIRLGRQSQFRFKPAAFIRRVLTSTAPRREALRQSISIGAHRGLGKALNIDDQRRRFRAWRDEAAIDRHHGRHAGRQARAVNIGSCGSADPLCAFGVVFEPIGVAAREPIGGIDYPPTHDNLARDLSGVEFIIAFELLRRRWRIRRGWFSQNVELLRWAIPLRFSVRSKVYRNALLRQRK